MMFALIRLKLLHLLGVDELVRKAFYEGFDMGSAYQGVKTGWKGEQAYMQVDFVWKHVDEAWLNSDAEESV